MSEVRHWLQPESHPWKIICFRRSNKIDHTHAPYLNVEVHTYQDFASKRHVQNTG